MGKADFLSPKAISNRIKAKGLQKLRWYCQMCQKQCRDENGFKCHCMSESHQRQLLLASENPNRFMDYFSDEFKNDFLELLRRRFGLCKVDETPKGWYVQYIDRDPETIRLQEEQAKKKKQELDDEERSAKFIEEQVRRGQESKETDETPVYTELKRESEEEKGLCLVVISGHLSAETQSEKHYSCCFAFNLGASCSIAGPSKSSSALGASALKAASSTKRKDTSSSSDSRGEKKKKSALEEIIEMEEEKKKKMKQSIRTDHWLQPNIVVKVITKRLGEKYHKKKAVITEVRDKYTAVVKIIDSGDKLKLDQNHVETVIPAPGKKVLILNGPYRDMEAVLEGIDEKHFCATLTLDSGQQKGKRVDIAYEDFSKLA
ncbi:DNA/RNA-binding protein KIN17 Binding to curved DNA KIN, antigenic determinant of recA protein [Channa argus]|uniref:DNA/RNA-binding protein KIN17 Binding to curved DNA KIN, antigenic determinant of recA protein n=1 Tax=Channa argus TaxID=215402 RepID=A0A6G1QRA8_CHAAH|nr:DNA/RNA-binding protein KIN17 Binding to curved DNA KIN, antigenic determinant of recA protein [Channa argus]